MIKPHATHTKEVQFSIVRLGIPTKCASASLSLAFLCARRLGPLLALVLYPTPDNKKVQYVHGRNLFSGMSFSEGKKWWPHDKCRAHKRTDGSSAKKLIMKMLRSSSDWNGRCFGLSILVQFQHLVIFFVFGVDSEFWVYIVKQNQHPNLAKPIEQYSINWDYFSLTKIVL